ncbi:MAG: Hint domain-containing protein [Acetobacteraceae bacterium]
MTDYAWFPVTQPAPGFNQWNPTGNWTDGAFWANATTITNPPTTGTVPGPSDSAYIVSANAPSFFIPAGYSLPPYNVTVTLDTSQTVSTLGLAQFVFFAPPPMPPVVDISAGSLDVTGAILDNFSKTFPAPVGNQTFTGGGTIELDTAGRLEVGTTIGTAITITFNDASGDTVVLDGVTPTPADVVGGTFTSFQGSNAIDLPNIVFASAVLTSYDPVSGALILTDGGASTVQMTVMEGVGGPGVRLAPDAGTGTEILVTCFVEGTRILSPRGEVAVERLSEGDLVSVFEDGVQVQRPVRWIGRRRIDIGAHPQPDLVRPIRIRQGACAENVPRRDLLVSPDHAILLDGVLIPARLLVNGATIVQDATPESVHYCHVELDRHSVLLAEGLATESYLDTGNRAVFENADLATIAHPDLAAHRPRSWDADACAPLATDPARVEPIWRRLAERAMTLGHDAPALPVVPEASELWLEVDGHPASLMDAEAGRHIFVLPHGATSVRLRSGAFRPSDRLPWLDDRRRLGVAVGRIVLHGSDGAQDLSVDDPALAEGWWDAERDGSRLARWTDGNAQLRLPAATRLVEIHLAGAV